MSSIFPADLEARATDLIRRAAAAGLTIATAESCTGGLVAALLTEIPGSSAVVDRGFVTYSNEAKQQMLGVEAALLTEFGAVSEPVARAMAAGALGRSGAMISVAITGIAGPGGGSVEKPVGLVHFACGSPLGVRTVEKRFGDLGRRGVRAASVSVALGLLEEAVAAASA
jgi:nicotinamide-nucleotide amidase